MSAHQTNLVDKNTQYAADFQQGHLALPPAKQYLILTCMDARIDPAAAFGIDLGDAHVIRNAGAVAKAAIRDIVVSEQLLGTKEIILIKHTGRPIFLSVLDFAIFGDANCVQDAEC